MTFLPRYNGGIATHAPGPRGGKVVAREVATVIPQSDIGTVVKGPRPTAGGARVEKLKGDDYIRVWINRGGTNYIINMPPA